MTIFPEKLRPARLHRSELAVPATSEHFFEKAARGDADVIFLDLEEALWPDQMLAAPDAAGTGTAYMKPRGIAG